VNRENRAKIYSLTANFQFSALRLMSMSMMMMMMMMMNNQSGKRQPVPGVSDFFK
jgi:hypothetical protein